VRRNLSQEEIVGMRQRLDEDLRAGRLYPHEAARQMRHILRKSQEEFAVMLKMSPRTYIDFERNVGNPTLETLNRIGSLFGLVVKFGPSDTLHDRGESLRAQTK
jgi:transcriptional regulator with XRE-family HTH domain